MLEKATEQEPETTTEPSEETIVEIETETAEPDQMKETIPESQAELILDNTFCATFNFKFRLLRTLTKNNFGSVLFCYGQN